MILLLYCIIFVVKMLLALYRCHFLKFELYIPLMVFINKDYFYLFVTKDLIFLILSPLLFEMSTA